MLYPFAGKESQQWSWVNADKTILENKKYGTNLLLKFEGI